MPSFEQTWHGGGPLQGTGMEHLCSSTASDNVSLTSDASGSWGCGAWQNSNWFQLKWDEHSVQLHIAAKELIPIIIAAIVWGKNWKGCRVTVCTVITLQW